jgi:hypothetical protein
MAPRYSLQELEALLVGEGLPRTDAPTLAAIGYYVESGGDPFATCWDVYDPSTGHYICKPNWDKTKAPPGGYSSVDKGLFQINSSNYAFLEAHGIKNPAKSLYNPAVNARAAVLLFESSGFGPWQGDLSVIPSQYDPGRGKYTGKLPKRAKLAGKSWYCYLDPQICAIESGNPNKLTGPSVVGVGKKAAKAVSTVTNPSTWKKLLFSGVFILGGLGVVAIGAEQLTKGPTPTGAGAKTVALAG